MFPPLQIIDNLNSGYSASGFATTNGRGYLGDLDYASVVGQNKTATWTFSVEAGKYEVATTWRPHPNRAEDAPFTILNGTTALSTVNVDQDLAPNDFSDQGGVWERLGDFTITSSQLVVKLNQSPSDDGYVIADAVRIELVQASGAPEINVIGNGASITDGDRSPSVADDTDFGSVNVTNASITHSFTIKNPGDQVLNITSVQTSGGAAGDFTVGGAPSTVAAGGSAAFTVKFDPSVSGTRSTTLTIVNNDADENPFDFVIQGTGSNGSPPPTLQIIDNGDTGYGSSGYTTTIGRGYLNDLQCKR